MGVHLGSWLLNIQTMKATIVLILFTCAIFCPKSVTAAYGCWIKDASNAFLAKDSLSEDYAKELIWEAIGEDKENTLCSRTYWFLNGYSIKCIRTEYPGVDCGPGNHALAWSRDKYTWREEIKKAVKGHVDESPLGSILVPKISIPA